MALAAFILTMEGPMKIRGYIQKDLEQCRSLWVELVQHHRDIYNDPSIGGDNPGLEFDQHLDLVGSENIWVVEADGKVVGLTSLILKGQEAEVEPVIIASSHRSQGIGQILLRHAVEEAKKLGVLCLSVKPVARNEDAISFFYNSGFKTLGHIEMFIWLGASAPDAWKRGPELFGKFFDY
jgi:ribosomal protein S18 acetylase RimI-like enzyme